MQDTVVVMFGYALLVPAVAKQLLLAAMLGMAVGFERALKRKVASLTTFSVICFGSCLFTLLSVEGAKFSAVGHYDVTRVAAQIVTGIGFVGGGVIYQSQDSIRGITTAALIWMAAALGMACGFNHPAIALWGFGIYLFILYSARTVHKSLQFARARRISRIRATRSHGGNIIPPEL